MERNIPKNILNKSELRNKKKKKIYIHPEPSYYAIE